MKVGKASAFIKRELVNECRESPAVTELLDLESDPSYFLRPKKSAWRNWGERTLCQHFDYVTRQQRTIFFPCHKCMYMQTKEKKLRVWYTDIQQAIG